MNNISENLFMLWENSYVGKVLAGQAMKPEFEFSEPTLKSDIDISMNSPRVRLIGDLKQRQFFIRNYGPAILEYS